MTPVHTRLAVAGLATAALVILAACSNNSATATTPRPATSTTAGTFALSGRTTPPPLSSAMSGMSGITRPSMTSSLHNPADVTFASMMLEHHQGVIDMADLAATRASNPKVKDLAAKIKAAQLSEIDQMKSWLAMWSPGGTESVTRSGGTSVNHDASDASGSAEPGMMTDQQTRQLASASGAAFDKLFLQLMIEQQRRAIGIASTEWEKGTNPDALTLAQDIVTDQTEEVGTMQVMLKGT